MLHAETQIWSHPHEAVEASPPQLHNPPEVGDSVEAAQEFKNYAGCITSPMLLDALQRLSAGVGVKQDHLLLFLDKLLARAQSFVFHLQCKTHVTLMHKA